jgi:hypothetical protein
MSPFVAKFENWSSLELDVLNKLFPTYGLMFDLYATHFIYKNIHQIEEHILSAMKFPPALQNQGPVIICFEKKKKNLNIFAFFTKKTNWF